MSDLLRRSICYAAEQGVRLEAVLPGPASACYCLVILGGHAAVAGVTQGTLTSPLISDVAYRACAALVAARALQIHVTTVTPEVA